MRSLKVIINTYYLLVDTLSFIQKKDKYKFVNLILLLLIQSILDVVTIASVIPLLYILEGKDKLFEQVFELSQKFNLSSLDLNIDELIILIPIIVILIILISTLSRLYIVFKTNQFIEEVRYKISSNLMEKYINNDFNNKNTSEVAKSILSEVDQFIIIVFQPTILMLTNIFLLLGILIYIIFTNISASLISIIILISFYFTFYIFSKRILNIEGIKSENANKGRFKTAIESFENIKDIKIYKAENYFSNRFKEYSKSFALTNSTYNSLVSSPKYLLEMIVFIILSFSIIIIGFSNSTDINSVPLLGTLAVAAYKAQPALSNIIYGINSLEYGSKIINNLKNKLKKKSTFKDNSIKIKNNNKSSFLSVKDLSFNYNKNEGINNINLQIDNPSLFIIFGKSGSGKSTLLNILSGLLKPQKGEILLNKKFTNDKNPRISFLNQNYSLIDASIAENVAFGIKTNDIDYENLYSALKKANIFNYVSNLKNSVFENVGEKGSKLSIGQRQRIALARAIYFKPDILLLDEPTSSLDIVNQKSVIKTILKLSTKITVIMSTHKLDFFPSELKVGLIDDLGNITIRKIKDINN